MTTFSEQNYVGDLVKVEPERQISRGLGTISSAAAAVVPRFQVLGQITASGKYLPVAPAANDGTQVASAILLSGGGGSGLAVGSADARSADVLNCTLLLGLAGVDTAFLQWTAGMTTNQKNAALAQLAALLIRPLAPA